MADKIYSFQMTPEDFLNRFVTFYNDNIADFDVEPITKDECFVVWYNFTLGNAKALVSTYRPDHKYYEMTYNANKNELYVDGYLKVEHVTVNV